MIFCERKKIKRKETIVSFKHLKMEADSRTNMLQRGLSSQRYWKPSKFEPLDNIFCVGLLLVFASAVPVPASGRLLWTWS